MDTPVEIPVPVIVPEPTKVEPSNKEKWAISVVSGLIFLLISSPMMYQLTDSVASCFGLNLATAKGCALPLGLLVHSVVFVLIVRAMMRN